MEDLSEFLKESFFCDVSNPLIQQIAKNFKNRFRIQKELAIQLFFFVRDKTVYRIGNWRKKASQTLKEGGGNCTNSSNLLVALLRAAGIPAGYGVMEVVSPDYFGIITHPKLAKAVEKKTKKSKHIYCFVFLGERWIKIDPSDDEPLSLSTQHLNPQSLIVNWDGENDAILNLSKDHVLRDSGPYSNIDNIINKKQRRRVKIPIYLANLYIQFLREKGSSILSIEMLESEFMKWLKDNKPLSYILAELYFRLMDFGKKKNA